MRLFIASLAFLVTLVVTVPALAEGVNGSEQAILGLNGVVTSPADVVVGILMGDDLANLPGILSQAPTEFIMDRGVGLVTGSFASVHRLVTGAIDMPMSLFAWSSISPEPMFVIFGDGAMVGPPPGFPGS